MTVALALAGAYQGRPTAESATPAFVQGIVSNEVGARIAGAELQFATEDNRIVAQTWSNGTYDAKLPPGVYAVRVMHSGFCEGRRGSFSARAGAEIRLDFGLLRCGSDDYRVGVGGTLINRLGYDSEELATPTVDGLKPLVLFGERKESDGTVHYSSLVLLDRQYPVVYTYDLLTIKAPYLTYSPKDHSIDGNGGVVWQDGSSTQNGSRIKVTFRNDVPEINLTK
ncbi:MAG: carboxypeptidase-like regulatory domain-containing protein [Acidobacteriia bacterium]|nr:carboxypeptidase-like regulatory domain-containing protein [Terriglobia bacterium]